MGYTSGHAPNYPTQNITAFLMDQNQQFINAVEGLDFYKQRLDGERSHLSPVYELPLGANVLHRARNHDLLTSLDVLTSGTYLRLPSCIKVIQPLTFQTSLIEP